MKKHRDELILAQCPLTEAYHRSGIERHSKYSIGDIIFGPDGKDAKWDQIKISTHYQMLKNSKTTKAAIFWFHDPDNPKYWLKNGVPGVKDLYQILNRCVNGKGDASDWAAFALMFFIGGGGGGIPVRPSIWYLGIAEWFSMMGM